MVRVAAGCNTPPAEQEDVPLAYVYRLLSLTPLALARLLAL
jgi:hypothetical protein